MQITTIIILTVIIGILVYLSGWFSGTETALTNLSTLQVAELQRKKKKDVKYLIELKKNMNNTLIAILIGNNLVNITLSALVALIADLYFQAIGVSIAIGIVTFLIIMFGEITPKSFAIRESEKMAIKNAKTLYYFMKLITPLIWMFIFLTRHTLKLLGITQHNERILVTEESIMGLATLGHKEGVLKLIEKNIIHKVFRFGEQRTKDIMVPINKVFVVKENSTYDELVKSVSKSGFARVPVINKDHEVVGVIFNKDLLNKKKGSVKKLMRPPLYFSIHLHITNAFTEMQKNRVHIGVIENNMGKHVGIITLEDIIEELVGEIEDEHYKVTEK